MPPTPGQYVNYWTNAKNDFKTATKTPKPADTFMWFKLGAGVEAALKKVDAAVPDAHTNKAASDKLTKTFLAFATVYQSYTNTLKTAIQNAPTDAKKLPKGITPAAYKKALEELRDELKEINNSAQSHALNAAAAANLGAGTQKSLDDADEFIKDVKADPRPATFNDDIQTRARDLTQQIGNVKKLRDKGVDTGRRYPENLVKVMEAWANNGRQVKANATQAEVLKELSLFEKPVNGVRAWLNE